MSSKNNSTKKAVSFEGAVKSVMGKKYKNISKGNKSVIKEMSKCQEAGGEIGTASSAFIEYNDK